MDYPLLKLVVVFEHAEQRGTPPTALGKTTLTLHTRYRFTTAYAIELLQSK
jgi:hypothetical protein